MKFLPDILEDLIPSLEITVYNVTGIVIRSPVLGS